MVEAASKRPRVVDGDDAKIKSVERAAQILAFFTPSRPRLTLAEMTSRLSVSKATAHRYAMALRRVNLLRYDRASATYTLGPQVLTLAAAARAGLPIISIAGPLMEALVRESNETVVLSSWEGEQPVVILVDDRTERVIRVSVRTGARLEPESAQGRVFAAYLSRDETAGFLGSEGDDDSLQQELETIREVGVAIGSPGRHGVRTIACPVFNDGEIVAVLALVGTTATLSDDISSVAAKALKRTAGELTDQYGAFARDDG